MKRYLRLIALYVFIAVAMVLLYAPWFLELRPWDYSLLRAGLSIICGIALVGAFGTGTYLLLKDPDQKLLMPSDVVSVNEVVPILHEYIDTPYVGGIAADTLDQVQSAERKHARLRKAVGAQFSEGSLTWERFVNLIDQAYQTVLRNAALLANSVQTFDRVEYAKDLADVKRAGNGDSAAAQVQRDQLAIHEASLAHMREIIAANERMLLELGKLELELDKLEAGDMVAENSNTLDELSTLIQETKYYA